MILIHTGTKSLMKEIKKYKNIKKLLSTKKKVTMEIKLKLRSLKLANDMTSEHSTIS